MLCYQSVPSGLGSMRCRRGNRPQGKTADPNSVITAVKRNDNNNNIIEIIMIIIIIIVIIQLMMIIVIILSR